MILCSHFLSVVLHRPRFNLAVLWLLTQINISNGSFVSSMRYLETPTTERTDRESSEECPRHRTFRPKLLTFSGGGPHPSDQAGVPVGYYPTFTRHLNIAHYMVIDYRLAATFTHRHHIMQTERYIFFVAVAFTLKITLTDRAHMSHQTLIRVLRPLRMRAPSLQHPKRTISFPRGNLIQAHGGSSVRPETRTHSELWCESGPVPFGVLPECTAAPARCFSTSPSQLALPGESCPFSD